MRELDGSHGEGGGQILRTAIFLSLWTGEPFRLANIRRGRPKPGLKTQHLHVLRAVEQLAGAKVSGAAKGSLEVEFHPGPVRGGDLRMDFGTAGSIPLWLQTILPTCAIAAGPVELEVRGGTDVPFSMSMDYLREVIVPMARPCFARLEIEVRRRGFNPKGGGEVRVSAVPRGGPWAPLVALERGSPPRVRILAVASRSLQKRRVAERMAEEARDALAGHPDRVAEISYEDSGGDGAVLTLVARCGEAILAADALGAPRLKAEQVARSAVVAFERELETRAPLDRHAGDNAVLWLALRGGEVRVSEVTEHTRTNVWVVEQFPASRVVLEGNVLRRS